MIVAATLFVAIISSSAVAGIMLAHAVFVRSSAVNAGVLTDEAQSFRGRQGAARLRLVSHRFREFRSHPCDLMAAAMPPLFLRPGPAIAAGDGIQPKKS